LAGLETIRIIREPVAAALAYGLDLKQDKTVGGAVTGRWVER
jgi:molecular chaperone DnaK